MTLADAERRDNSRAKDRGRTPCGPFRCENAQDLRLQRSCIYGRTEIRQVLAIR
jgi:hypothetical protein